MVKDERIFHATYLLPQPRLLAQVQAQARALGLLALVLALVQAQPQAQVRVLGLPQEPPLHLLPPQLPLYVCKGAGKGKGWLRFERLVDEAQGK